MMIKWFIEPTIKAWANTNSVTEIEPDCQGHYACHWTFTCTSSDGYVNCGVSEAFLCGSGHFFK